jgi:hypothetical protein
VPSEGAGRTEIWIIDTCSILEIRRPERLKIPKTKQAQVYARLDEFVETGALVYPREVLKELERQTTKIARAGESDLPYEFVKRNAEKATMHGADYDALCHVLAIPGVEKLLDPDKPGVEPADPYVLALAHHLNVQGCFARVITEDRRNYPDKLAWKDGPPSLPKGAKIAIVEGDPSKEGPFVFRVKAPDGYRIPPHTHSKMERVTVISGTFNIGMPSPRPGKLRLAPPDRLELAKTISRTPQTKRRKVSAQHPLPAKVCRLGRPTPRKPLAGNDLMCSDPAINPRTASRGSATMKIGICIYPSPPPRWWKYSESTMGHR